MLNMKVNNEGINITTGGTIEDIVTDILKGVDTLYGKIKETDEDAGDIFEALMMTGLMSVFKPEETAEMVKKWAEAEMSEELDEEDEDILGEVIATLERIRKVTK